MTKYRKCSVIIVMKDGKAFAGERMDVPDAWQFPQGGVDGDESFVEAAVRELYEETGILNAKFIKETEQVYRYKFPKSVQELILYKYGNLSYIGQEQKFCLFQFTGMDSEIDLCRYNREFKSWKWMDVADIAENIVYFKKDSYTQALTELGLLK